jgi:endonuclease YncB( thermonuclease family)
MNKHQLLHNSVIADTETVGLNRGSGMTELSIFDLDSEHLHEILLKPNMVITEGDPRQELTKLASSAADKHLGYYPDAWTDVMAAQASIDSKKRVAWKKARKVLRKTNAFLSGALDSNTHPHLLHGAPSVQDLLEREEVLKKIPGVRSVVSEYADIRDVLKPEGQLEKLIRGKTVWIANAAFESKQLGAQLGAIEQSGEEVTFKSHLETSNPNSSDPFYVTGKEVNKAKVLAQRKGDWTLVWKAMINNMPKEGETAVRDIQDVTRSFMAYGKKLGLTNYGKKHHGSVGIDLTFRLFGSLEEDPDVAKALLGFKEVHRASEDSAISERYVLEKATYYTDVLQQVDEKTKIGREYIAQAQEGHGPLSKAADYFAREEVLQPEIDRQHLIKRLGRAREDIAELGATYQADGFKDIIRSRQRTPDGRETIVHRNIYNRVKVDEIGDVVEFLKKSGQYTGIDIDLVHAKMVEATAGKDIQGVKDYVQAEAPGMDKFIASKVDEIASVKSSVLKGMISPSSKVGQGLALAADGLGKMSRKSSMIGAGAGALLMAGAGVVYSNSNTKGKTQAPSITAFSYDEWLTRQESENPDLISGMGHKGWAGESRKHNTDFGSPYQGPVSSGQIMYDQELLQEREKWLRKQYGARHFDPEVGLFGKFSVFKRYKVGSYANTTYISGGTNVAGKYKGLQGKSLLGIDVSDGNWKMTASDADTITLKRGGVRGAISSFFGMNRGYDFRLAGIDSTETHHGSSSYHAPQPHAEAATAALQKMIARSKKLELVYDPTQTTYGRMMGAVVADGKNLNFELVRQGQAAHLPFGSKYKSMIDYDALKKIETQAYQSRRGMWAHPWSQAFYEFSEASGNRLTLNTLTRKSRIAENVGTMDAISLMEQAQAQGHFSAADAVAAATIGQKYKMGPDKVRPFITDQNHRPHNNYMDEMKRDLSQYMVKGGGRGGSNRFSRRGGYGELDGYMALDSMGRTNSVWSRRKLQAFQSYGSENRLARQRSSMAEAQRHANQTMFQSPIGHHQM